MAYLYEVPSKKFLLDAEDVKVINGIEGKKILAFGPHSDDLSIGAGGFLFHLSEKNTIVPVCGYSGWRGVNKAKSKEEAVLIREREMEKEAEVLGLGKPIFLRLSTYESDKEADKQKDKEKIKSLIENQKPQLIFLPNPLDLHPRHKLLTQLILSALSESGVKKVDLIFYEIPWSVFSGNEFNYIVPLSSELMRKKIAAIKVHKSQLARTDFVKLAKALMSLRAGIVPEQKIGGYGSKLSLSNWVEVYEYKNFK